MDNKIKVGYTFTQVHDDGTKVIVEIPYTDITLIDLMYNVREFLLGCGFSAKLVEEFFDEQ